MNKEVIQSEVMQAEATLLTALREGELLKGVSIDLNSPDYRNIWNGEFKTYDMLETRIKAGIEKGLKSIDYRVHSRDFSFINSDNVLETLSVTETTTMKAGSSATSGVPAVTILWQRIDNNWRLRFSHASELPKGA